MEDELFALQKTTTWELVPLPVGLCFILLYTFASFVALLLYVNDVIITDPDSSVICEAKYANEFIHSTSLIDTKISNTPIELNVKLNTVDRVPLDDPTLYRELVDCLVSLTVTCLDLDNVVHVGLLLSSTFSLDLVADSDIDCAGDVNDHKPTQGFCLFLDDSLISWQSKKQAVVARSVVEAEYRAMAHATTKIV
ncbi:uncharacterized protein LOC114315592 [Camellia sinensis]|uniref:uncharacterized protein LOC114315592 n=1 Tax=Camellia sinensis TaxID=4442 RepID=UPI0010358C80|nr:uncharacterized protein LOC114315592 [Camellia sinensis]